MNNKKNSSNYNSFLLIYKKKIVLQLNDFCPQYIKTVKTQRKSY